MGNLKILPQSEVQVCMLGQSRYIFDIYYDFEALSSLYYNFEYIIYVSYYLESVMLYFGGMIVLCLVSLTVHSLLLLLVSLFSSSCSFIFPLLSISDRSQSGEEPAAGASNEWRRLFMLKSTNPVCFVCLYLNFFTTWMWWCTCVIPKVC